MENGVYTMLIHMNSNECEDPLLERIPPPSKLFSSPSFNQRSGGNISRTNGTNACSSELSNLSNVPSTDHLSIDSERFATASSRHPLDCPASSSTSFSNDNPETKESDRKSSTSTTSQRVSYDLFLHKLKQSVYRSVEDVRLVEPKFISINGYSVPCLMLNGEPYVPMSACLRRIFPLYKEDEIFLLIEDLHIALLPALENEAKLLQKLDDVCAQDAIHNMYLMSQSDIERILGQVRLSSRPTPYDDISILPGEEICVSHHSYPELVYGTLFPSRTGGCCILCTDCHNWFSPEDFVCHTHSTEIEPGVVHWGLDSNNWQFLLQVDGPDRQDEEKTKAFQDFKSRRRFAPLEEQVLGIFKREAETLKDDRSYFLSGYEGYNQQEELDMELIKQCSSTELDDAYADMPPVPSEEERLLKTNVLDKKERKTSTPEASDWTRWQEREHYYDRSISAETQSDEGDFGSPGMKDVEDHEESDKNSEEQMRIQMINMSIQHQADALTERNKETLLKNQLRDARNLYAELYDKEQLCGLNQLGKMFNENSEITKYLRKLSSNHPDPSSGQLAQFVKENEIHKHSDELAKACEERDELKMFNSINAVEKDLLSCNPNWMLLLHQFLEISMVRLRKVKEHMRKEKYKFLLLYDYANTLCILVNEGCWPKKSFTRMFVPNFLNDPAFINQGLESSSNRETDIVGSLDSSQINNISEKRSLSCESGRSSSSLMLQQADSITNENGVPSKKMAIDTTVWNGGQMRFSPISPASISPPTLKRKSVSQKSSESSEFSWNVPSNYSGLIPETASSDIRLSTGTSQNITLPLEQSDQMKNSLESLPYSSAFKSCGNPIQQCNGDSSIPHPIAMYPNQANGIGRTFAIQPSTIPCWTNHPSLENMILSQPLAPSLNFAQQNFQAMGNEKLSTFVPNPKPPPEYANTVMSHPVPVLQLVLNPPPPTQGGAQHVHLPSQPPSYYFNFDPSTYPGILHPR
ncbi:unnamed protein product [Auanema sp. JU1783]|nr:unnamed protein product [Auanema sp. JU1783]